MTAIFFWAALVENTHSLEVMISSRNRRGIVSNPESDLRKKIRLRSQKLCTTFVDEVWDAGVKA